MGPGDEVARDNGNRDAALLWKSAAVVGFASAVLLLNRATNITSHYFRTQDAAVVAALCLLLVLASRVVPHLAPINRAPRLASVATIAICLATALWLGTHWLMLDYPLTRDEHMVQFDAGIFSSGKLAEPLALFWRPYSQALVPAFLLRVPDESILVSGYLPVNAMMRSLFAFVADPAAMNPLLAGAGLVALFHIARRLFPNQPMTQWVVLAGYALSSQVIVTAMTAYAMTPHLALNLIWLAFFLEGRWWQHLMAAGLGALAIGLHQVVFHPLFAAPFVAMLLVQRKWVPFAVYAVVYPASVLFWFAYPSLVVASVGVVVNEGAAGGAASFVAERVVPLFTERGSGALLAMHFNLVRFAAFAPFFALPFALFAWPDIRALRGLAMPLFAGIILTILGMFVLLPYQGHGWGYRYLHGVIGNVALLGGYGFTRVFLRGPDRATGLFALLAGATVLLAVPFLLWSAHAFVAPYARLSAFIEQQRSDYVVIDTDSDRTAIDQIRNRADLSNRPILLASSQLDPPQVLALCDRGSVTLLSIDTFAIYDLVGPRATRTGTRFSQFERLIAGQKCLRGSASSGLRQVSLIASPS